MVLGSEIGWDSSPASATLRIPQFLGIHFGKLFVYMNLEAVPVTTGDLEIHPLQSVPWDLLPAVFQPAGTFLFLLHPTPLESLAWLLIFQKEIGRGSGHAWAWAIFPVSASPLHSAELSPSQWITFLHFLTSMLPPSSDSSLFCFWYVMKIVL